MNCIILPSAYSQRTLKSDSFTQSFNVPRSNNEQVTRELPCDWGPQLLLTLSRAELSLHSSPRHSLGTLCNEYTHSLHRQLNLNRA